VILLEYKCVLASARVNYKNGNFFKKRKYSPHPQISTLPKGVFIADVDETMTCLGIYSVSVFINWPLKQTLVENTNPLERR